MWVVLIVAVLIVVAIAAYLYTRQRKSQELRERFGPEYERTVSQTGSQSEAEAELRERQKRVEALNIRPLSENETLRYREAWRRTQARFVDEPVEAVKEADRLVNDLMQARGYPMGDFEQRAADISVDHPHVVENYRAAHEIAERVDHGRPSTEELRQAMKYYRDLFNELLETQPADRHEEQREQDREVKR